MHRSLAIVGRNKNELYFSFPLFVTGMWNALALPHGFEDSLWASGFLIASVICVVNAVADRKRMSCTEYVLAVTWFPVLVLMTVLIIWDRASMTAFSPR